MLSVKSELETYERQVTPAERLFTRSPFSIVTMVARINGAVSEELLRGAVNKVQQRHALLQVRIVDDPDHGQRFTSDRVQEIPIQVVPRQNADDWIRVHTEASRIPFEFENRPPIRFILVHSPAVSEVIILCHHIICDGLSLAYLARDLMTHLGDPDLQPEILPDPAPITLDNLPGDVSQSRLRKLFINRLNRKWRAEGVCFDQEDYEIITRAYWDHIHHRLQTIELSEAATSALVDRCKQEDVTVNSAITAAFSGAQSAVEGEKPYHAKTVIATSLRDRLPDPAGEAMGFYAAGVELDLRYDHKSSFWHNARKYHEKIWPNFTNKNVFGQFVDWLYLEPTFLEAMNFKKLGALVPPDSAGYEKLHAFSQREDTVSQLLKRDKMESLEMKIMGPAITNLGRLDFPRSYGPLELERLIMQPGGAFPLTHVNMVVGVVTCAGKLSLLVEYAEEAVDSQTMAAIKDQALLYLTGD